MKPVALIQLVSEQTMQNLLPVMRLKPVRLVHVVTPKTAGRSEFIAKAARQEGVRPTVETVPLSAMPSIRETAKAIADAIDTAEGADFLPIVNFTGGTKLMSVGAFAAAQNRQTASMYVDTQEEKFVDGETGSGIDDLLDGDFTFAPVRSKLRVNSVAVAHGKERVTDGRDWKPLLPFARHMFENQTDEQATHDFFFGEKGLFRHERKRTPRHWLRLLDTEITLPSAVSDFARETKTLERAKNGSLQLPQITRAELEELAEATEQKKYLSDFNKRLFTATRPIQEAQIFLTGGWWEVIVADAAERSGLFRDIRWSAEVGERDGASLEEDILALEGVRIVNFCCKRGGHRARLIPLLEELKGRTRSMGGHFSRSILAIHQKPHGQTLQNLESEARKLDVALLFPRDLDHLERLLT